MEVEAEYVVEVPLSYRFM